jgi:deoxyribonuclease V
VYKVDVKKAKEEQLKLAKKIIVKDDFSELNTIGGCDLAYTKTKQVAVVVVLDYKTLQLLEVKHIITEPLTTYIPTFLSYRESPAIIKAFNMLETKPDLLIFDSNGILHPRRIGSASHAGLLLDTPTIGVAKKLLCGEIREDKVYYEEEARAYALKTKPHAKPIFISPGHKVSLKTSLKIVKNTIKPGSKLPEPIRLAHKFAVKQKQKLKLEQSL